MPRKRVSIWGEALLSERERFMMRKPKRDGAYLAGQRDKGGSSLKARQRQTAKERAMAAKADRGSLLSISSAKMKRHLLVMKRGKLMVSRLRS